MMKLFFVFLLASFFITSCATKEELAIRDEQERQKLVDTDKSKCISYGFTENTEGFSNCMLKLDLSRQEEKNLKKILKCERIKKQNNDPNKPSTGFWGGVLEGLAEADCD